MVLILDTRAYGAIKNGARMAALAVPTHGTARMNVLDPQIDQWLAAIFERYR